MKLYLPGIPELTRGRAYLRKGSIIFLAVMLAFTFLSRAAASVTTAQVYTQKAVSGKISHSVSASGKIETTREISVTVQEGRKVEEVYIQTGDRVEAGDPLFKLSENRSLAEAQEAFRTWETKSLMDLEEASDAYLTAYENWREYLEENASRCWKSSADRQEDELEEAMRSAQYVFYDKYKTYLQSYTRWQEDAIENPETEDASVKAAHSEANAAGEAVQSAKESYYEYRRSREKSYQYSRTEDETKLREALEEAIPEYEDALTSFESELAEKVKDISAAEDGLAANNVVYAETAGTVKAVNLLAGDQTGTSSAAVLASDSEKKKVTVSVPTEYAEYITVGDSVTLTEYGETDSLQGACVSDVEYDEDDQTALKVTVTAENEELTLGEQVEVTFDSQSEQYSMLIPVSAIYSDNQETYVLIVQETEGIMGSVTEAKKITVEILDKNSSYAAISASEAADQDIIIRSDREVKDGSRVRKAIS